MEVKLEYLGEDKLFPGSKKWKIEAIHVTTTRNQRKFTLEEQRIAARSLSFRPLNINHESSTRGLPFPQNCTEGCHFNESRMAVDCIFRVSDPSVNAMIESGRIHAVSIEQIPTLGEKCDEVSCEQHGVAYIGMALLENHVPPGDKDATGFVRVESLQEGTQVAIKDLMVSDEQRKCKECSDFEACHTCQHKTEADDLMEACLQKIGQENPEMPQEMRVVHCLEELNRVNKPAFTGMTIRIGEALEDMKNQMKSESLTIAQVLEKYSLKPEYAHYYHKALSEPDG